MTASADYIDTAKTTTQPVRLADGSRMILRGLMRLGGVALILAGLGLWLAPGASWESDVMLFKLVLSICAVMAGYGLAKSGGRPGMLQAEIDTIRREVRLLRSCGGAMAAVLERASFAELTRAEVDGTRIRLFGPKGQLMAEVSLPDGKSRTSLLAGLRDAGKLA